MGFYELDHLVDIQEGISIHTHQDKHLLPRH